MQLWKQESDGKKHLPFNFLLEEKNEPGFMTKQSLGLNEQSASVSTSSIPTEMHLFTK